MRENFTFKKARDPSCCWRCLSPPIWALGAYTWNFASAQAEQQELALMMRNRDLLKKDIQRARENPRPHSRNQKDCDAFEQSLFRKTLQFRDPTRTGLAAGKSDCTW